MSDSEIGIAIMCAIVLGFAAFETWRVTRPFVRARREAERKARAEAAGHAAE